jgi:hypothetical protein
MGGVELQMPKMATEDGKPPLKPCTCLLLRATSNLQFKFGSSRPPPISRLSSFLSSLPSLYNFDDDHVCFSYLVLYTFSFHIKRRSFHPLIPTAATVSQLQPRLQHSWARPHSFSPDPRQLATVFLRSETDARPETPCFKGSSAFSIPPTICTFTIFPLRIDNL